MFEPGAKYLLKYNSMVISVVWLNGLLLQFNCQKHLKIRYIQNSETSDNDGYLNLTIDKSNSYFVIFNTKSYKTLNSLFAH